MKKITKLAVCMLFVVALSSCMSIHNRFFRGDVISFSDKPITSYKRYGKWQSNPYNLLQDSTFDAMRQQINSIPRGNNTAVYYAMELAAKRVKYVRRNIAQNDPYTKYYIFLLTDGLDNASSQAARNAKDLAFDITPEKYQKRLQKKFKSVMGMRKNLFEIYPVLFVGPDLLETGKKNKMTKEAFSEYLNTEMQCFRFSSKGEAPKAILGSDFKKIEKKIAEQLKISSYTFRVPKGYRNKKVRMELTNETGKQVTLTGVLKKSASSYYLKDVQLTAGASFVIDRKRDKKVIGDNTKTITKIKAEKSFEQDDNRNAYFVLDNLRFNDIPYHPQKTEESPQSFEQRGVWQINSEYEEVAEGLVNTYCIIVMDGSYSLGEIQGEKECALSIIDMLDTGKN